MALPTLWLYLHFPELQLNSLFLGASHADTTSIEHDHGELDNEKPLIIIHGRYNEIIQLNKAAENKGIKLGMGLATASSLCQHLCIQAYDPEFEKKKLIEIAHWLYLITSDISFSEPRGLLLRVSNMLTLYDGLDNYWAALKQHLDKLNFSYHFASAYSPLAAQLLAKAEVNTLNDQQSSVLAQIKQQSLSDTELPHRQVDKLARVGIRNMGALLSTPMPELAKRFDLALVTYVGRLNGSLPHPVDFYHPPQKFVRYLELLFELSNLQSLSKPLLTLLQQLETFLSLRDQYADELCLRLHLRDKSQYDINVSSAKGDYLAQVWLSLFSLRFESIRIKSPVLGITLSASRTRAKHAENTDLFEGLQSNNSPLELISILQAKLGHEAIKQITLSDDPRPELSTKLMPWGTDTSASKSIDINRHKLRPSILLPKPQTLRERVTLIEGPERIATGWWDDHPIIRDYFIARAHSGAWLWVFRTPRQHWYLHGVFS